MASLINLSKVTVAGVIAGALAVATAFGGPASASANAEGVDIFIWQKPPGMASERPAEDVAFYYNRIAFNYASSTDSKQ